MGTVQNVNIFFFIGLIILLLSVVGLAMLMRHVRKARRDIDDVISTRFQRDEILCLDSRAVFFGIASCRYAQIRGNGVLVLTGDELFFRRLLPEMELSIHIENIVKVDTPRSFLGKSIFKPLLRVDYRTPSGQMDAAAWYVRNLHEFRKYLLSELRAGKAG